MMRSAYCFPCDKFPNIARLVREAPGKDPVSINVFLCRDYLTPFRVQPNSRPGKQDGVFERLSLLDWATEGINIVVMYNSDPEVFEAAAAFDNRRTHRKRKLVLLVDTANQHEAPATALIGTTSNKGRNPAASRPRCLPRLSGS